jgi:phosphoribosylglycinamide formyltransferase-1
MTPDTQQTETANDSRHRRHRLAVLISGRGSNLQAILDATAAGRLNADVASVVSDRADAAGLVRAREAGIDAAHLDPKRFADRDSYDRAIVDHLRPLGIDLICLAGYMRIVGPVLRDAYPDRIVNIHPSLLPSFPGLHAQRQALEHGVRVAGATVHLVNGSLDAGPIVLQAAVPVLDGDDEERLSARILAEEHRIYPEAIRMLLEEPWSVTGRRVVRRPPAGA